MRPINPNMPPRAPAQPPRGMPAMPPRAPAPPPRGMPAMPPRGQQANMPPPQVMPAMPPRGQQANMPPPQVMRGGAGPQSPAAPQMQGLAQLLRGQQANMPPPSQGMPSQGMPSQGMGNNIGSFLPKNAAMPTPQAMGGMGMKKGGKVSSASSRADGCATKGKTKGRFV